MAIQSAQTLSSSVTQAIKDRYYDELFLRVAEKNLVHQQLGQLNRQVPKGSNITSQTNSSGPLYWTRWVNLANVTTAATEGAPTTAVGLSAVNVTGIGNQYDNAVSISDLMVAQSFGDVMKAAMQRLAYNAGVSIDTIVRDAVVTSGTVQLAGGTAGAASSWSVVPSTATFSMVELRKALRSLRKNDAFKVGGSMNSNDMDNANGYWVAVISPDTAYDITGDSATGAWIDSNRYAGSEMIFNGEIGKLYGTRFLETSNARALGAGNLATATVGAYNVHQTLITGSDYFGVSTLQNLQTFIKDFGSGGIADPTNKVATAGWKTTFGVAVLNSTFAVSLANAVSN